MKDEEFSNCELERIVMAALKAGLPGSESARAALENEKSIILRERWEAENGKMKDWKSCRDEKEKYGLYLASREWAVKKEAVKRRSKGICERCFKKKSENVHHLTYVRKYDESLDDLADLCLQCHRFIHSKTNYDHQSISKSLSIVTDADSHVSSQDFLAQDVRSGDPEKYSVECELQLEKIDLRLECIFKLERLLVEAIGNDDKSDPDFDAMLDFSEEAQNLWKIRLAGLNHIAHYKYKGEERQRVVPLVLVLCNLRTQFESI